MLLDGKVENTAPPLWGRKWKIIITLEDGTTLNSDGSSTSTGLDVSNLRVTGSISDTLVSSFNPCEITIYNLNKETEKLILSQGKEIYIELGYNAPELYGNVYTGKI